MEGVIFTIGLAMVFFVMSVGVHIYYTNTKCKK